MHFVIFSLLDFGAKTRGGDEPHKSVGRSLKDMARLSTLESEEVSSSNRACCAARCGPIVEAYSPSRKTRSEAGREKKRSLMRSYALLCAIIDGNEGG